METKIKSISWFTFVFIFLSFFAFSQGPPWLTGGNIVSFGDFMGSTNNAQVVFKTNSLSRMIIDGGTNSTSSGRIAIGNNLPSGFIPQSRIHIHQIGGSISTTNDTYIRFTNNFTGPTNTDGFAIGNSNGFFSPNGDVHLLQYEVAPIIISLPNFNPSYTGAQPYEWMRIQNGQTFLAAPTAPSRVTDGYIGLNVGAPRTHIEMITPAFQGGEEFFMAKPSDIYDPPTSLNKTPWISPKKAADK